MYTFLYLKCIKGYIFVWYTSVDLMKQNCSMLLFIFQQINNYHDTVWNADNSSLLKWIMFIDTWNCISKHKLINSHAHAFMYDKYKM